MLRYVMCGAHDDQSSFVALMIVHFVVAVETIETIYLFCSLKMIIF